MNFLKKIFSLFNKSRHSERSSAIQDELTGLWENDLDDGSGLHAIWGWTFRFNEDGKGMHYYWSNSKTESETPFNWQQSDPETIFAKYHDEKEWTTISYTIQTINAPYSGKLLKLTDNNYKSGDLGKEGFWDCFGAIFKPV